LRRLASTVVVLALALVGAPAASATEIIARNATNIRLVANSRGEALLTYLEQGQWRRVRVWGAVNAIHPTRSRPQVAFGIHYAHSGGFEGSCGPYDGPRLPWLVVACEAPDGSYWAVQVWQRMLPNFGVAPSPAQAVWELHLSHWTGALPKLEITMDWSWRRWEHLYGRFTYKGVPVHGFASTPGGVPLDSFGRNVFLDTFDSAYGPGWERENSFLTHKGTGVFCYSINPHGAHPAGNGKRYRATVKGPGVTPLVMWEGASPGPYNHRADQEHNRTIAALGDRLCRPN
jgi:hypothetical protein